MSPVPRSAEKERRRDSKDRGKDSKSQSPGKYLKDKLAAEDKKQLQRHTDPLDSPSRQHNHKGSPSRHKSGSGSGHKIVADEKLTESVRKERELL